MIKKIVIGLIVALVVLACDKEDEMSLKVPAELPGSWALIKVTGGFTGEGYQPDFSSMELTEDRYTLLENVAVISDGDYEYDSSLEFQMRLFPDPEYPVEGTFEQHDKEVMFEGSDTLFLIDPCCDLFNYMFVRKR